MFQYSRFYSILEGSAPAKPIILGDLVVLTYQVAGSGGCSQAATEGFQGNKWNQLADIEGSYL